MSRLNPNWRTEVVAKAKKQPFNVSDFLSNMDGGRTPRTFRKNQSHSPFPHFHHWCLPS